MTNDTNDPESIWCISLIREAADVAMESAWTGRLTQARFSKYLGQLAAEVKSPQILALYCTGTLEDWRPAAWHGRHVLKQRDFVKPSGKPLCEGDSFLSQGAVWMERGEFVSTFGVNHGALSSFERAWVLPVHTHNAVTGVFAFFDPDRALISRLGAAESSALASSLGVLLWFVIRPCRSLLPEKMSGAFAWKMDVRTQSMLDVGDQAMALSGYDEKEWYTKPGFMMDHTPSQDAVEFQEMLNRCRRERTGTSCEHRMITRSGGTLWLKTEVQLDEDEAGYVSYRGISLDISQLKGGQQVIQSQMNFLQTLTENLGVGFAVIDGDGIIQFVNPAGLRILDANREELIGTNVIDSVKAWDTDGKRLKPDDYPIIKALKEGHPIYEYETLLPKKDGDLVTVASSGCPIFREGKSIGAISVFHDVTESARANHALRVKADQFEGLVNSTFEGLIVHDRGAIVYANRAITSIFGYTQEEVLGRHLLEFAAPESKAVVNFHLGVVSPEEYEAVGLKRDGGRVSVLVNSRNIFFAGRMLRLAALQDVTVRLRQQKALQLLARAGAALSSSLNVDSTLKELAHIIVPDLADWCMVDLLEPSNVIRRVAVVHFDPAKAEAAERFKSLEQPKLNDLYGTGLTLREGRAVLGTSEEKSIRRLVNNEQGLEVLRDLGMKQYISIPLVARTRPVGVLTLVYCDEKRSYGREDMFVAEELASRAALAIDNARLYEAEREAVKRREQVVEAVAHDLKNPLTAVKMSAELAANKPAQLTKALETIQKSASQMQALIFDLLDLAKINAGITDLELAKIRIHSLIEDLLATLQPLISAKKLTLKVEVGEQGTRELYVDRSKCLQVLSNILGNAVKYTPAGGEISLKVSPFTQRMVLFEVTDNGPGIDPEGLPYVFDRFWQQRGLRKSGIGLGLSIAKAITEAHGGIIWAESQLGHGASFYFTFPLATEAESRRKGPPGEGGAPSVKKAS